MRLFVGLDIPAALAGDLARVVPSGIRGLRPVLPGDMHLTLHFIGVQDKNAVVAALGEVTAAPFEVDVGGLGFFGFRDGRRVLWAGIAESEALSSLHRATAAALARVGFEPESRPYRPHLTLARIDRSGRRAELGSFVAAEAEMPLGRFAVREFALYDSAADPSPLRYTRLARFPLVQ